MTVLADFCSGTMDVNETKYTFLDQEYMFLILTLSDANLSFG